MSATINIRPNFSTLSLFDYLLPSYIQNTERNNFTTSAVGQTRYKITIHDTVNKIITFDQPLPTELSEAGTDWSKRWIATATPGVLVYISSVDFANKSITYSYKTGTLSVGNNVCFCNPYRVWTQNPVYYIIGPDTTWAETYPGVGPIWKHSDGDYRMIVNGYTKYVSNYMALFKSSDLITWTNVDGTGNYKYKAGEAPFNKTWCTGTTMSILGGCVKITSGIYSNYYAVTNIGRNTSGACYAGVVIIDEDFNIIYIPDNPLTIPGYPLLSSSYLHLAYGTYSFNNKLYANISYRNYTVSPWEDISLLCELDKWDDPTVINVEKIFSTLDYPNTPLAENAYVFDFLEYRNTLYAFVVFETWESANLNDTPLFRNFEVGVMYKENDSWVMYPQSPIIINPVAASGVWSGTYWCSDSLGNGIFYRIGNQLNFLFNGKEGADTYKIGRMVLTLPE